jgi:HK97 family phage major capsid protein
MQFDIKGLEQKKAAKVAELNASIALTEKEDRLPAAEEKQKRADLEGDIAGLNERIASVRAAMDHARTLTVVDRAVSAARRDEDGNERFKTFGQFIGAVVAAGKSNGRMVDQRLLAAATGMSEAVPSDGGWLVPQEFAGEILGKIHEQGKILSRVRTREITVGNGLRQNAIDESSRADGSRWGGVQAYWVNEAGTPTKSKPKFRRMETFVEDLAALYYATNDELEDAEGLGPVLQQAFAEEIVFKVEDAIINGDGAAKPVGILTSAALISVTKEAGQAAKTLLVENIVNMWSRLHAPARDNAIWIYNQDIEPQLFTMGLAVGFGGVPLFMAAGGLGDAPTNRILGRPAVATEYNATLGTVGDIVLADFSQYQIIRKGGLRAAESIHVQFLTNETTFRVIYRVNGQPLWDKALTPFKGSNTQSPFVTLATRA